MEDELPDFAGLDTPAPEAVVEAQPAPEAPQEATQQAPAAPVAEASPQPALEAAQTVVDPATGQHVPLPTFLDMRDRATLAEKRAKELEDWRRQQEAAAQRQPPPNPQEDPAGYLAHQEQRFNQQIYSMKMGQSRRFAEMQHGPEVVKTAFDWGASRCDQDPYFNEKVRASDDPIGFVVAEWKRDQVASKIDPSELEAFLAWKAAQPPQQPGQPSPATPTAGAQQSPPVRPAAPRPSIAAAPSAGASSDPAQKGGDEAYREMFG